MEKKIIFSARYGLGNSDIKIDIFLMDANGGSIKRITGTKSYDEFGIWIKG